MSLAFPGAHFYLSYVSGDWRPLADSFCDLLFAFQCTDSLSKKIATLQRKNLFQRTLRKYDNSNI